MKQPVTLRIDRDLLTEARSCAVRENRTLTNFIETLVLERVRREANARPNPAELEATAGRGPTAAGKKGPTP